MRNPRSIFSALGFLLLYQQTCYCSVSSTEVEHDVNDRLPDNDANKHFDTNRTKNPMEAKCRVYLAESSIPNAGLGMYSAVDIPIGESIGNSDIMIPIFYHSDRANSRIRGVLNDYLWDGRTFGAHSESSIVVTLAPGILAAVNGHAGLKNVQVETATWDGAGLHRSVDPGSGAFSLYHDVQVAATSAIEAGMELFADYGNFYFASRNSYEKVPIASDYVEADDVVNWFEWLLDHNHNGKQAPDEVLDRVWGVVRNEVLRSPLRELLPDSSRQLMQVAKSGTARYNAHPHVVRSLDWLHTNGQCVDNLRVANSTVPQAGRGAFATRFLPKGSLIAPAPLIHITDKDQLVNTYSKTDDDDQDPVNIASQQLLLNYCFGHANSTLLLCPYSSTIGAINHNRNAPNAKLAWSSSDKHNQHWLNMSVDELGLFPHTGLMFDFIATQDIKPGEEIFIDYGREWEEAWDKHIREWSPSDDSVDYLPASALNDVTIPIRTEQEQNAEPYPDNVHIFCHYYLHDRNHINNGNYELVKETWKKLPHMHEQLRPCRILNRNTVQNQERYTAKITSPNGYEPIYDVPPNEEYIIDDIPREAIKFVDKMYTSDMHLPNAFRHELMIPDDLFPAAWKNLKTGEHCTDQHEMCHSWASEGECRKNPAFMHIHCADSCDTCGVQLRLYNFDEMLMQAIRPYSVRQVLRDDVVLQAIAVLRDTVEYMKGIRDAEFGHLPREILDRCRNDDARCAVFAARGECENNPLYMNRYCAPSCKTCHLFAQYE